MDFTFDEIQRDLRGLADRILGELVTHERLKELTAGDDPAFDRRAWAALAEANLLGVCLPESGGGSGFGVMELCLLCEQVGRHVAPVPLLASVGLGGMTLAAHGSPEQQAAWLPGVIDGSVVLTAGLEEPGNCDRLAPVTRALVDGDGWRIDGEKTSVPYASVADRILVPATTGQDAVGLFLVD
ncbi:MAG: acyl-CoA/acyl-ACP dehydrogenase, partial [Acidimicrobiales bacterium]|nr:acyl-CoA/acyl-ACP dehydrogenase [Acidimicrobiales bacterium]